MSEIQQASVADYEELKELMDKANKYAELKSGVPLWRVIDYAYNSLAKQLAKNEVYVIRNSDGKITSAIGLSEESSAWLKNTTKYPQSLFLSKLMKEPVKAGPGEAKRLLKFAVEEARRRDKKYLRADTVAELEGLVNYYLRMGFKDKRRFVYKISDRPGVLLEIETEDLAKYLEAN